MRLEGPCCGVCECVTEDCGPCYIVDEEFFLMKHGRSYDIFAAREADYKKHLGSFQSKQEALGAVLAFEGAAHDE